MTSRTRVLVSRGAAVGVVLVGLILLAACAGGSDSETTVGAESQPTAAVPEVDASSAFCENANRFVTSSDARLITTPTAAVFDRLDAQLGEIEGDAPPSVSADVSTLRAGFVAIGMAYEAVGFEPSATVQLSTDVQDANRLASTNLRRFLENHCDLDAVRQRQIAQIRDAFGIEDDATAECLHAQMGDVVNIESSSLTPELMTMPVCGTSIFGLLSGIGETDS